MKLINYLFLQHFYWIKEILLDFHLLLAPAMY